MQYPSATLLFSNQISKETASLISDFAYRNWNMPLSLNKAEQMKTDQKTIHLRFVFLKNILVGPKKKFCTRSNSREAPPLTCSFTKSLAPERLLSQKVAWRIQVPLPTTHSSAWQCS